MSYRIRVERIIDGSSFMESEPIAVEEIGGYLKTLSEPCIFGTGDFRFILIPA